jgi:hypothetical protein
MPPLRLLPSYPSTAALMIDGDRDFSQMDPARLLPFVCELIPVNPDAVIMSNSEQYLGAKASDEGNAAVRD